MTTPAGTGYTHDDGAEGARAPARDDFEYARFVAELRVLETRLLTQNQLLRMVEAPDADTAFRMLAETEYGPAVTEASSAGNYEAALSFELARVFRLLRDEAPEPALVSLLGMVYDWQNLKVALKAALTGKPVLEGQLVVAGNLPPSDLMAIAAGASLERLPQPYRDPAVQVARAFAATQDPQQIDLMLDAARFVSIIERAKAWQYGLVAELASTTADLVNMRTLLRLKLRRGSAAMLERALVPGGVIPAAEFLAALPLELEEAIHLVERFPNGDVFAAGAQAWRTSRSLAVFERLMDDRLLHMTTGAHYVALSPDPVIAYLMAKETEIKNLRIIFTGKINLLPENTIRERLRETHA